MVFNPNSIMNVTKSHCAKSKLTDFAVSKNTHVVKISSYMADDILG